MQQITIQRYLQMLINRVHGKGNDEEVQTELPSKLLTNEGRKFFPLGFRYQIHFCKENSDPGGLTSQDSDELDIVLG